jgi:regulator of extracellular matrix RemA (YlzA/DUF370 family)
MAQHGRSPVIGIGFGNLVLTDRIVAIIDPSSSAMKRLREEAGRKGKLLDATKGRRTRAIIVTDSDHIVLSAIAPETLENRMKVGT